MLVSSSRTPEKWIVPGGGLEPEEGSFEAAEREVMEEAGIRGTLSRPLGQFEVKVLLHFNNFDAHTIFAYIKNLERKHRTSVFVLVVTEELDEWDDSINIGKATQVLNCLVLIIFV